MANGALGAEGKTMAGKLHKRAFVHVESLILSGMYPIDGRDAWSEHQPSAQKEDEYIRQHDYFRIRQMSSRNRR
jgi:hypothetical protein